MQSKIIREEKIPRTFRFTLASKTVPEITQWVQKIRLDMRRRQLRITLMEGSDQAATQWLCCLSSGEKTQVFNTTEVLTLTNYDAAGQEICSTSFEHLCLKNHKCDYDYSRSGVLKHHVTLGFNRTKLSREAEA